MKTLVTGSSGFLGSHFARELEARGHTVTRCDTRMGLDAMPVFSERLMVGAVFDLVVHCAAVEPHRAAIDGKPMHLATNLALDAAMFDWAYRTGQKRVLYISSSAAYPVRLQTWEHRDALARVTAPYADPAHPVRVAEKMRLREHHINHTQWGKTGDWSPDAGYGWLKLTGERMALDAAAAGLAVHVVRPFSGYGETQGGNWPFGAFASRARRRDDPFVIWGDGTQVRDWIHVSDVVHGALAIVEQDVREPVNLCTGVGTSMADLVRLFCDTAGYAPEIQLLADKPAGVAYRVGDPTLFHQIYKPVVSLEEGVARALGT